MSRVEQTPPGEASGAQQVNRNTLLASRGDGTWAEVGRQAGVEASGWSWSALFLDVDLDGFEDLLIPNGHIRDLMDADTQIRIREAGLSGERESTLLYRRSSAAQRRVPEPRRDGVRGGGTGVGRGAGSRTCRTGRRWRTSTGTGIWTRW